MRVPQLHLEYAPVIAPKCDGGMFSSTTGIYFRRAFGRTNFTSKWLSISSYRTSITSRELLDVDEGLAALATLVVEEDGVAGVDIPARRSVVGRGSSGTPAWIHLGRSIRRSMTTR
jgi:hypothetical protein